MIQRAHFVADKEEIICLWQQCFGDERHYVEFFLKNCPEENALFLYREEDVLAGMMFLLQGMIVMPTDFAEDKEHVVKSESQEQDCFKKVYYLYALCVDEQYRNRGIAAELLDFAKAFAKENDAEVCLVPSTEELRRYYAKRGFVDVFVKTEQTLKVNSLEAYKGELDIKEIDLLSGTDSVDDADIDMLVGARAKEYGAGAFLWRRDNFKFAIKENTYSGGFACIVSEKQQTDKAGETACAGVNKLSEKGGIAYIIGEAEDKILIIRETNLKLPVIYRLAIKYNCDRIRFSNIREPVEDTTIRTSPYAMMTNRVSVEKIVKSISFDKRYINFCFD